MRRSVSLVAVVALALTACSTGASASASADPGIPAASSGAGTADSAATPSRTGSNPASNPTPAPTSSSASEPAPTSTAAADPAAPPGFAITDQQRRDLPRYQRFRYQTAVATGLPAPAAAGVDVAVARLVDAAVEKALTKGEDDCLVGRGRCASFEATLTPLPCRVGYLCLLQEVSALWPAAAIPYRTAQTLVFDATTGREVALTDVVSSSAMPRFLRSVREAVDRYQRRHSIRADDLPDRLAATDIEAWAPLRKGIRVWFDEYAAAPGFFGVVPVRVPYPA